jgi:hypothetical protein
MAVQRIDFTQWEPDKTGISQNLSVAKNVIPSLAGYVPFPLAVDYSLAASENLNNTFASRFSAGASSSVTNLFAGGATKLFKFDGSTLGMTNVSKSVARAITNVALTSNVATITTASPHGYSIGNSVTVDASNNTFDGTYTVTTTPTSTTFTYAKTNANIPSASATGSVTTSSYSSVNKWNFIQFGNTVIAANNINKLQSYIMGTSTAFGDLDDNAPVAKFVTVVRDFVVAANLSNESEPNKIQWSDINNETNWVSGAASQSDYQIISDGGNVTGITGGEFGLVFLERSIVRMTYIGSPFFFQFDTISRNLGCTEGNSIAQYGNMTYFLGEDGFYMCDGKTVTPIGNERVDRFFYANVNPSKLDQMSTVIDPYRKIVVWNFLNNFAKNNVMIYNWQTDRWSFAETDVNYVSYASTPAITLEGMDLYGNMDTIETSFDSRLFAGGKLLFAGVRGRKVVTFTGQNSPAQIVTGDIGSQNTSIVNLAKVIVDNGSADVAIASRTLLTQIPVYSEYVSADSENRVSLRSGGKYHRLSIKPTGDQWNNILAVDIEIASQGVR